MVFQTKNGKVDYNVTYDNSIDLFMQTYSTIQILINSCNTGRSTLPDIYALALGHALKSCQLLIVGSGHLKELLLRC